MGQITHSIPPIECYVDEQFLTAGEKESAGIKHPCVIHSCTTIPGQALLFNILLEDGSMFQRLPIWSFEWKSEAPKGCRATSPSYFQEWEVPSSEAAVVEIDLLKGSRIAYKVVASKEYGEYLFTIDFSGSPESESFGDFGHKPMHICKLDVGVFVASPNNRLCVLQKCFVTKPWTDGEPPKWRSQRKIWRAER
jgi:hypothetical protein